MENYEMRIQIKLEPVSHTSSFSTEESAPYVKSTKSTNRGTVLLGFPVCMSGCFYIIC